MNLTSAPQRGRPAGRDEELAEPGVDLRVRAGFVGAALIASVGLLVSAAWGTFLALVMGGWLALGLIQRDGAPLSHQAMVAIRHRANRSRADGTSESVVLHPWPHVATLPAPLTGTELLDAEGPGHDRCGVVWHRPTGLMSATVLLEPSVWLFGDPAVSETYAACWWALTAEACARTDVVAAAVTVDVPPGGGPRQDLRFTLTVDPCATQRTRSVFEAAALTVGALAAVDARAAGVVVRRPATAADLARIARAAFEPRERWSAPGGEPPAWGELAPWTERIETWSYHFERYSSVSYAMHAPSDRHFDADLLPWLLLPGSWARRVTLVRRAAGPDAGCSVFVTVWTEGSMDLPAARVEIASIGRTARSRPKICSDLQPRAFGAGLPVGWFGPVPAGHGPEVTP